MGNVDVSIIDFCHCGCSACSIDGNLHLVAVCCFLCCFDIWLLLVGSVLVDSRLQLMAVSYNSWILPD